eukprot:TRINITY_DN3294_c0_g1_i4.p1 TRINITY_DN3294_c0_g1~~TRINITY_DN3294_c0_g1_i4.p1  ORF type:complete len:211 (-),score=53.95 TRINITY_DN3294_c0_g1_i4:757-1389(-)
MWRAMEGDGAPSARSEDGNEGRHDDIFSVRGKRALVTGSSSGLGRVFALELARRGCHVVVAARRLEKLDDLVKEISGFSSNGRDSGRAFAVELNVRGKEVDVDAAVQRAWDAFNGLDVLVNNAGYRGRKADILELTEEEWDETMETNLRGCWLVSKAVVKRMASHGLKGSIINISSIAGSDGGLLPSAAAYTASKAGMIRFSNVKCALAP